MKLICRFARDHFLYRTLTHDLIRLQIFGSRVRVDSTAKVAEIEMAEKEKMKEKVERILKHGINCFINRSVTHTIIITVCCPLLVM